MISDVCAAVFGHGTGEAEVVELSLVTPALYASYKARGWFFAGCYAYAADGSSGAKCAPSEEAVACMTSASAVQQLARLVVARLKGAGMKLTEGLQN